MKKRCLMISGGRLSLPFARDFLKGRSYECVIAVDAGFGACLKLGLHPQLAVGDFDTFGRERILCYQEDSGLSLDIHEPVKDETDTELAFFRAQQLGAGAVDVLGATGGRLDHEISNIHLLLQAKKRGLSAALYDEQNKLYLLDAKEEPETEFTAGRVYGKYVSFLPLTETVRGITLTGFKYPLVEKDISILENPSLCVSNELAGERAVMRFREGILICVESAD
ncbi:MAG: thiamine diphosphokinase [Lachnospiraceae bacterium]|jgi:thiamine pyrophosphokinase|nr:thiamine diphosphokinase [Lachnospiraceae bacterium]